jgi:hypothetical protein
MILKLDDDELNKSIPLSDSQLSVEIDKESQIYVMSKDNSSLSKKLSLPEKFVDDVPDKEIDEEFSSL